MFINKLVVVSVLLIIFISYNPTASLLLPPFYWNQTTFRPYQDSSLVFEVRLGDVMDLICPFYDEQQSYMTSELEQYDIYRVTEQEYKACSINQYGNDPITRRVITCNSPYDLMKYTLNFRSYLPIPNGFEFRPNQTYYFLSTSFNQPSCNKLEIRVHDYHRITGLSTSKMFSNEKERKPTNSHHYTHYRHSSSSVDKLSEPNNIYRPFLHAIKAQRHSDPYSIKWITESPYRPNENENSRPKSNLNESPMVPSHILSLALSSSSTKLSLPTVLICFFLCLR